MGGFCSSEMKLPNVYEFLTSEQREVWKSFHLSEVYAGKGITTSPLLRSLSEIDALAPDIQPADVADLEGTVMLLSEIGILP